MQFSTAENESLLPGLRGVWSDGLSAGESLPVEDSLAGAFRLRTGAEFTASVLADCFVKADVIQSEIL